MRTVFYIALTIFLFSTSAWADSLAVEEVPQVKATIGAKTVPVPANEVPIEKIMPVKGAPNLEAEAVKPPANAPEVGTAIISAKGEKLAIATGHYARARALLIASLREFDKGLAIVDPNALVDSSIWRNTVLDRADDLQKILDPQPRKSRGGVRFDDSTAKIGDAGAIKRKE